MMNFNRLIAKYSVDYDLVTKTGGGYDSVGKYVAVDTDPVPKRGAITKVGTKRLYQSGGSLTTNDLILYSLEPISSSLSDVKVRYKDCLYDVLDDVDYSVFAGVYQYVLKYVSAFGKEAAHE